MRRLIVTADDFGLALPVNEAVEEAHRRGVLTCASLMAAGAAARDAVERARRLASLRVGLHVVVVRGAPLLPPHTVPDLADPSGVFPENLWAAGVRYFLSPRARAQLEAEIRAQFEWFQATGLELDHVNAHCHMHLHPTVLDLLVEIGLEFGLRAVRVPEEPRGPRWLRLWIRRMRRRLREAGLRTNDFLVGMRDSGALDVATAVRLVRQLPPGVTEIYFHPAAGPFPGAAPGYRYEAELQALLSRELREAIEAVGAQRISYRDLTGTGLAASETNMTWMGIN
jgi:hopanoid biosynthesis associated protein HpnK